MTGRRAISEAFSPDGIKTRALAIDSFTFPLTLKCLVQLG